MECTQYASKIWKTQQWPHDWKRSVFIPIPKKGNAKECSNYYTIALISHASKVMLKILQVRLKQCMNCELPDVQLDLEKAEELEQIANIFWIIKRAREFQKTSTSALLTTSKPFTVWITTNCGKFLMGMPDNLICLLRCFYAGQEATVRTGHRTTDWFQIRKGAYYHPAYLTYMQSTS